MNLSLPKKKGIADPKPNLKQIQQNNIISYGSMGSMLFLSTIKCFLPPLQVRQTGTGHFSPIAGYHEGRDLILVLDVVSSGYEYEDVFTMCMY